MHAQDNVARQRADRFAWSRDGVAVLAAMVAPALGTFLYFQVFTDGAAMQVSYTAVKLAEAAFPLLWVWAVQGQCPRFALPTRRGVRAGLVFGLAVVAAMVGLYYGYLKHSHYLETTHAAVWEKVRGIGADTPEKFWLMAFFITVIHAGFEEYYWRWFVFGQMRRAIPWGWACAISGLAFALHHVIVLAAYMKPEHFWTTTMFFSLCVAAGGMAWAWVYQKSGSLYGPWLSHVLVDAGLMWIGFDLCRPHWP